MSEKLQAGELICDGQSVTAGMKFLGSTQTHSKAMDKLALKASEGKEGFELGLWSGVSQKGLSAEVLLRNLSAMVAHRRDLSIEAETTAIAEMISGAGIPIQVVDKEGAKSQRQEEKDAAKAERKETKASRVQMATLVKYVSGSGPWKPNTTLNIFTERGNELVFDAVMTRTLRMPLVSAAAASDSSMETIHSSRVTATRIATVGIFALAAKKKKTETVTHQYLHVEGERGLHLVFETKKSFDIAERINSAVAVARDAAGLPSANEGDGAVESSTPANAASGTTSIPDQIRELAQLKDAGVLTDEEFAAKKAELLARM